MTFYILKLAIMLPLIGLLIYGTLWLYRKYQPQTMMRQKSTSLNIVEVMPIGVNNKLAVVDFEGRKILLSVTRNGVAKVDEKNAD
ncbi:flagellar biosynthetic protein FliO [Sphingorhabdus sp. EL138]|uniref:flagellar biosynthetic protein FliO n=1 Tax=Sphingorhabdus sp. EL138 TaxID=2073156 RepID=UPI000D68922A|nr:flagellar biosynthetic protein FliO [Sphingorhabdus sp. EL138]